MVKRLRDPDSKVKPVKVKRKRKPMTDEQKAAAVERLAKARAAKAPTEQKSIPENIRNIPDNDILSVKSVRAALKQNKELLKSIKIMKDSKDSKERAYYQKIDTYIANMQNYLFSGIYKDNKAGMDGEKSISYRSIAMAYYPDGMPKRTVGVVYPDCGKYTQEMEDQDRGKQLLTKPKKKKITRKVIK